MTRQHTLYICHVEQFLSTSQAELLMWSNFVSCTSIVVAREQYGLMECCIKDLFQHWDGKLISIFVSQSEMAIEFGGVLSVLLILILVLVLV